MYNALQKRILEFSEAAFWLSNLVSSTDIKMNTTIPIMHSHLYAEMEAMMLGWGA